MRRLRSQPQALYFVRGEIVEMFINYLTFSIIVKCVQNMFNLLNKSKDS